MNKVVFTAGVLTVVVVGGIFFCAGLFTGANVDKGTKIVDIKDKHEIIDKIYDKIPGKPPVKKVAANDEENQNKPINIDNLLNEIVASHNTADECLLDSVKTKHEDPVTMNQAKRYVVYIGYFPNDISEEISQLMMAKGYPIHIQISHINEDESFVFCGPFKNKKNAEKLMKWLNSHNFTNAKLVSHKLLQTDEIDLDAIEEDDDLQKNGDNRKRRTSSKKSRKNVKQEEPKEYEDSEEHDDEKHEDAEEHHEESDEHKEEKHEDTETHEDEEPNEDSAAEEHHEEENHAEPAAEEHHEDNKDSSAEEHHDDEEHSDDEEDDHVEAP